MTCSLHCGVMLKMVILCKCVLMTLPMMAAVELSICAETSDQLQI